MQVCIERAIVVKDLFTGGKRSFASSSHARDFRAKIYAANGLKVPSSSSRGNTPPQVRLAAAIEPRVLILSLLGSAMSSE